jgi:hypothetical protein
MGMMTPRQLNEVGLYLKTCYFAYRCYICHNPNKSLNADHQLSTSPPGPLAGVAVDASEGFPIHGHYQRPLETGRWVSRGLRLGMPDSGKTGP